MVPKFLPPPSDKVRVRISPTLTECRDLISTALKLGRVLFVAGDCTVKYEGRASSQLDWGERILLIKSDGALLIHRKVGHAPVNWQPPTPQFHVQADDEGMTVTAIRQKPPESIRIHFRSVSAVMDLQLEDAGEFAMHVTEEQMKQALIIDPSMIEEGLKIIAEEHQVKDSGFTDLYGEDSEGRLVIVEIKRVPAGREAALQLNRYIGTLRKRVNRPVRGILAAPKVKVRGREELAKLGLEFKEVSLEQCFKTLKPHTGTRLTEFFEPKK